MAQIHIRELYRCLPLQATTDTSASMSVIHHPDLPRPGTSSQPLFYPYVSGLVGYARTPLRKNNQDFAVTPGRQETHLTNLFGAKYKVEIGKLALREHCPFRIACHAPLSPSQPYIELKYQAMGNLDTYFWRLLLDGKAGTVQMYCPDPAGPLVGAANVTQLPGIKDALFKDINTLRQSISL